MLLENSKQQYLHVRKITVASLRWSEIKAKSNLLVPGEAELALAPDPMPIPL
jgi:hypothetical protein